MNPQSTGWGTPRISQAGDFLRVIGSSHYFFGPFACSSSGRYTIGWSQGTYLEDTDRPKENSSSQGSFVLIEDHTVLLHGWCSVPTLGRVANNGTALICDTGENSSDSNLQVFDCSGAILYSQLYRHAVGQCGISGDGRYSAVHEATEVRATDRLNLIDLQTKETLWQQFLPYHAQPVRLEVEPATKTVAAIYHDGVEAIFDFSGHLDEVHLRQTQMQSRDANTLLTLARGDAAELSNASEPYRSRKAKEVFELLRRASQSTGSPIVRSQIMEVTGELMETLELSAKAIEAYQKALELNPQANCRKRLQLLQRRQGDA